MHNVGEVSQICKRDGLRYVCVQRDATAAQRICEILDAFQCDNDLFENSNTEERMAEQNTEGPLAEQNKPENETGRSSRNLENTEELLVEISELVELPDIGEGRKTKRPTVSIKTLGSSRKTRSQARTGN